MTVLTAAPTGATSVPTEEILAVTGISFAETCATATIAQHDANAGTSETIGATYDMTAEIGARTAATSATTVAIFEGTTGKEDDRLFFEQQGRRVFMR